MILKVGIIVFFIVLGIIFSFGKGAFLIAGFNTLEKEERDKYDVPSLCRFMGKLMFLIAFCIGLLTLSDMLFNRMLYYLGNLLLIGCIVLAIVYMNTGDRFKKK